MCRTCYTVGAVNFLTMPEQGVFIPYAAWSALEHGFPLATVPRKKMSLELQKNLRKSQAKVLEPPWSLHQAAAYYQDLIDNQGTVPHDPNNGVHPFEEILQTHGSDACGLSCLPADAWQSSDFDWSRPQPARVQAVKAAAKKSAQAVKAAARKSAARPTAKQGTDSGHVLHSTPPSPVLHSNPPSPASAHMPPSLPEPLPPSQASTLVLPSPAGTAPAEMEDEDGGSSVAKAKASPKGKATAKGKVLKRPAALKVQKRPAALKLPPPAQDPAAGDSSMETLRGHRGVQVRLQEGQVLGCKKCRKARIGCKQCRRKAGMVLTDNVWAFPAAEG